MIPDNLKSIFLQRRKIIPRKRTSQHKQLPIFPALDVPADLGKSESRRFREVTKNQSDSTQILQSTISRLKVIMGQHIVCLRWSKVLLVNKI